MRPLFGIILELVALAAALWVASLLAGWYPVSILVLLVAQALATILIHCPAHYVVGSALGIRFSRLRLGRSAAVKALPGSLEPIGSLMVVFSLSVHPESRRTAPPGRMRAMYLAGLVGSVGSAIAIASAASLMGNYVTGLVTWLFALGYLVSDIKLSPKSGDLMRARAAARP